MKFRTLSFMPRVAAVGLVMLMGASAMGQITKQGNGFLMRLKHTVGEVTNYSMTMKSTVPGMAAGSMDGSIPLRAQVKSVKNGVATVSARIGPGKMGPQQVPQSDSTFTVDSRGRMTGSDPSLQQMQSVQFPAQAIPLGGTWTNEVKPAGGMPMTIRSTYKLVRTVTRNGMSLMEVAVTGSTSGKSQMKMNMTGTMFLRMSDGSLHSSTLSQVMTISMPQGGQSKSNQPMKVTSSVSITRR